MTRKKTFPPLRFARVEEDLYRGSHPTLASFPFLKRIGLKTILSLVPDEPISDLTNFCACHNITHKHFKAAKWKESMQMQACEIARVLEFLVVPSNLPLYIHCLDGTNTTGVVIACLRKLQNYHNSFILAEYSRFVRTPSKLEIKFIEHFKNPVYIVDCHEARNGNGKSKHSELLPSWLWGGRRIENNEHPSIRLLSHPDTSAEDGREQQKNDELGRSNDAPENDKNSSSQLIQGSFALAEANMEMQWGDPLPSLDPCSIAYRDSLLCRQNGVIALRNDETKVPVSVTLDALSLEGATMQPAKPELLAILRHTSMNNLDFPNSLSAKTSKLQALQQMFSSFGLDVEMTYGDSRPPDPC
mmetsp:Transcript_793/g.1519  ORF Transcript_793/g.1519 Transcript_793/m.1519 type:complete len:358 (+) Transcript_793:2-1075(+)